MYSPLPYRFGCSVLLLLAAGCSVQIENNAAKTREQPTLKDRSPDNEASLAPVVEFLRPTDGAEITTDVYDGLTCACYHLPSQSRVFVLARNRYGFFLMWPPPLMNHRKNTFVQDNIRIKTNGSWELHAVLASAPEAIHILEGHARRGEWSVPTLPDGAQSISSIKVRRSKGRSEASSE